MNKAMFRFLILASVVLLSSCKTQPTTTEPFPDIYGDQPPGVQGTPVTPPQPPIPGIPTVEAPENHPLPTTGKTKVTLVLGGAGVASFATVGILKRFQREGIEVEAIVSTGWPSIFALGYGFLKSVHDLEWFAMRMQKDELTASTLIPLGRTYAAQSKLSTFLAKSFPQPELSETRIPILIGAGNVEPGGDRVMDRGNWLEPLVFSLSMPGISQVKLRRENKEWFDSIYALNVDEGYKRGAKVVIAVSMYADYFTRSEKDTDVLQSYIRKMKESVDKELNLTKYNGRITLKTAALDFGAKRRAITEGDRLAGRIIKSLRQNNFK